MKFMKLRSVGESFKNAVKNPARLWKYILIFFVVLALALFSVDAYIFYRNIKIKNESVEPLGGKRIFNKSAFESAISILQKKQERRESIKIPSLRNPFTTNR